MYSVTIPPERPCENGVHS